MKKKYVIVADSSANLLGIRIVGRASDAGELEPLHKSRGEKRAMGQLWECIRGKENQ